MNTAPALPASPAAFRRVVLASMLGTAIEWYDFFLYGTAAALVFNRIFFPTLDPQAGTLAAFASYAVGFFARPLGGIIFGHYGDRVGRKAMLVTSLVMMGVATFLVGLLPTYDQIGFGAPLLLVLLRLVQGVAVGGEWGGAVLMVAEHADKKRRGFFVSWVQVGVPVGLIMATGSYQLCGLLPESAFLAWGWRVPFLFGIVLTGLGFFIRRSVLESPVFERAPHGAGPTRLPLLEVLQDHRRSVLLAMGARLAENAFFYIFTVWILSFATQRLGMQKSTLLNGVLLGSAVQLIAIPYFGALSDRRGRKPVYIGGTCFLLAFTFPFFWLVETGDPFCAIAAIVIGLVGHAALYGPQAAFFSELFATRTRYTGASLGYQLASPLAGGLAPLIATGLLGWSGGATWPIAIYLSGMAAITLVSVWLAAETNLLDLSDQG